MRLYHQLAQNIRAKIESGEFKVGKALPSERKLAEMFDVSRDSVRNAITMLTEEQLLETKRGSGSYVRTRLSESFSSLTSLSEEATARGMESNFQWISRAVSLPTPDEVFHLGISPTDKVSRIARLRKANNEPLAIQIATITCDALPDPNVLKGSLYQAMKQRGKRPVRAYQRISAVSITGEDAKLLEVKEGSSGLKTWRVGYCKQGMPVEFTISIFRGDRWDFITELTISEESL